MATQKDILEPLDEREGYNIGDFAWMLHEEGDVSNAGIVNEAIREHKQLLKNVGDLQKTLEQTEECYAKLITTEIDATNRCGELQAAIDKAMEVVADRRLPPECAHHAMVCMCCEHEEDTLNSIVEALHHRPQ